MNIEATRERALQHHKAGEYEAAEQLYTQIIETEPEDSYTHFYSGILAYQQSQLEKAAQCFRRAIEIQPNLSGAHSNLGLALHDMGQPEEAIKSYDAALRLQPDAPAVHSNRGKALLASGRLNEALQAFDAALAPSPDDAETHNLRGMCLHELTRYNEAIDCFDNALRLQPELSEAFNNRGRALSALRRFDEALQSYAAALEISPEYSEAHFHRGMAFKHLQRLDDALGAFDSAIRTDPSNVAAHTNRGEVLMEMERKEEALLSYRTATDIAPKNPEVACQLANALEHVGQLQEAIDCWKKALETNPEHIRANSFLAMALLGLGEFESALDYHQAAIRAPYHSLADLRDSIEAHHSYLYTLNMCVDMDPEFVYQEHVAFGKRFAESLVSESRGPIKSESTSRKIKIGYVSADFKQHSVSHFIRPVLDCHDHDAFEIHGYFNSYGGDDVTSEIKARFDHWHDISQLNFQEVAARIRQDEIDVLVDLSGHTAGNSLMAFAYKPAPIQISWIGYPNTTGLSSMDYRIVDAYTDPEGLTDALSTEKLVRMPQNFSCYAPPQYSPDIAPPPYIKNGFVTFGSFNNPIKVNDKVLAVWADILNRVPNSRLFLKGKHFLHAAARERVINFFSKAGVDSNRLIFAEWASSTEDHLQSYNKVDIALDPFPYNGTTTTCEALWMGIPVIALAGNTHASRVGVSILSNLGLEELIAKDREQYARLAAELAENPQKLTKMREGMRERLIESPLLDAAGFTRDLEERFRTMYSARN